MTTSRYAFLTLPNYSLIAVSNAIEVLRMANRVLGQDAYEWCIASLDGRPVLASSGLDLAPTVALDKIGKVEILFVCGGINVREAVTAPLVAALKRVVKIHIILPGRYIDVEKVRHASRARWGALLQGAPRSTSTSLPCITASSWWSIRSGCQ